jgi:bacterioferritin
MKGHPEVVALLNKGLAVELTAVNQYLAQSKMNKHWGYHKLADHLFKDYQEERLHAETLIERILFLEGTPDIKVGEHINLGKNVKEQLENDLQLETNAVKFYNDVVQVCSREKDAGSREIAEFLLRSSEDDVLELESQLNLIKSIGLENFLIEMIGDKEEDEE